MLVRKRIQVSGLVQGVGFRPYVFRLAGEQRVTGNIINTAVGVTIEAQGPEELVREFTQRLPSEKPPLAYITEIFTQDLPCVQEDRFQILESNRSESARTLISADVATCEDCLREVFDPKDRRYLYPFTNCTNCGPRFTIIRSLPYDRPSTSMSVFKMCPECQSEYDEPADRRFHAQPNACWQCGPQLELRDAKGSVRPDSDPMQAAVELLRSGAIIAIKGLGGFHLAVDATNARAVNELRLRKHRIEKPFAVMISDIDTAASLVVVGSWEREALLSPQRPIVLAEKKMPLEIADVVAPGNRNLGVFLPYTPLHHMLFKVGGFHALVMTSANLSEEPIVIGNEEAQLRLRGIADYFLFHNRDILLRCDDSVVHCAAHQIRQVRRSRGLVPLPIFVREELPEVLAVGGQMKTTVCLTKGRQAFLSQHIGDMENLESYNFFQESARHLQQVLEIEPVAIAHDLHPQYMTTQWALQQDNLPRIAVQHHHAHIASCMAENGLDEKVIGIALDGTGYGMDGSIWGGEVLLCDYDGFERAAHLEYVRMPGGEAVVKEPWRMALSYVIHHFGAGHDDVNIEALFPNVAKSDLLVVRRMLERGVNSPWTSSCGRLFDAVAAFIGIRSKVSYEAQAAIELEASRDQAQTWQPYPLAVEDRDGMLVLGTRPLFEGILGDLRSGASRGKVSQRFHDSLIAVFVDTARRLKQKTKLTKVCLSGGSFQNRYLLEQMQIRLLDDGLQVFSNAMVPAGDGGLSLGQAMIAIHKLRAATHIGRR